MSPRRSQGNYLFFGDAFRDVYDESGRRHGTFTRCSSLDGGFSYCQNGVHSTLAGRFESTGMEMKVLDKPVGQSGERGSGGMLRTFTTLRLNDSRHARNDYVSKTTSKIQTLIERTLRAGHPAGHNERGAGGRAERRRHNTFWQPLGNCRKYCTLYSFRK
jgi:hypothetical protein